MVQTLFSLFFLVSSSLIFGQLNGYVVYFTDKDNTPYSQADPSAFLSQRSIERRINQGISITTKDLPVDPLYVDSVNTVATVRYTSRWLNAAYIQADASSYSTIQSWSFISGGGQLARKKQLSKKAESIIKYDKSTHKTSITPQYGVSQNQVEMLGIDDMHALGYTGSGLLIGVLDSGFENFLSVSFMNRSTSNNKIKAVYDFVDQDSSVTEDDAHGLKVLSVLTGYQENSLIGGAFDADYILLRTENAFSERPEEMFFWLVGAEYCDSAGVDIISSSLGYNEFDNPLDDLSLSDLDGETSIATRAADAAARTGMVVVCSVGNEGAGAWEKMTVPADADSVLAVGATNSSGEYMSFSSRGNTADGRIKPDVAAQGSGVALGDAGGNITFEGGTSFSCPLVTSLAAGLWQAVPELTNIEVMDIIRESSSQFDQPDSLLGYGIPDFTRAYLLALSETGENFIVGSTRVFPNPIHNHKLTVLISANEIGLETTIQVYDVRGIIVNELIFTPSGAVNVLPFDFTNLPVGLYHLKVSNETGSYTKRLVKS